MSTIELDVEALYKKTGNAKLGNISDYISNAIALALAGSGNNIVLTGQGPIWLYLKIAHALHGKARKLIYRSPVTGNVVTFDHSPE